ncbi:MAG: hypothetical protein CNIPEHKO_02158 [Anaerolineales bacterium]|nr:hypothetical protein [Anaerolineales bacterium]
MKSLFQEATWRDSMELSGLISLAGKTLPILLAMRSPPANLPPMRPTHWIILRLH